MPGAAGGGGQAGGEVGGGHRGRGPVGVQGRRRAPGPRRRSDGRHQVAQRPAAAHQEGRGPRQGTISRQLFFLFVCLSVCLSVYISI